MDAIRPEDYERYRDWGQRHLIQPNVARANTYAPDSFKLMVSAVDGCRDCPRPPPTSQV